MILDEPAYLEHYGKKGMKWGVRRDPKTGVRPIANTLDKSKFGQAANRNAQRSMARSDRREARKQSGEEMSTQKKVLLGATAAAFMAAGLVQTERALRHYGGSLLPLKWQ